MSASNDPTFDVQDTYVHLEDGPAATLLEVGPDFWEKISSREDLSAGRLVSCFHFEQDWDSWERHPAGDEIVCLLSGAMDFVIDDGKGERVVPLRGRAAVIVPRGAWHRARVREPSDALFITRGAGTEVHPLAPEEGGGPVAGSRP